MVPPWAPAGSDDSDERPGPTLDDRPGLGGVSETQRRNTIVSLVDQRSQTPYTIGELTDALSKWFEQETEGMVPTEEEIHSVLYDFDLPRLDAADRLVFDRETGRVFSVQDADPATPAQRVRTTADAGGDTTSGSTRAGAEETTSSSLADSEVSAERVVELGVLLLGVAGVALTASSISPFDTAYALVPAALVVLFFGYRAVVRR